MTFFLNSLYLLVFVLLPLLLFNIKYRESIGKDERLFPSILYLSMDEKWGNYFFVSIMNSFASSLLAARLQKRSFVCLSVATGRSWEGEGLLCWHRRTEI